MIVVSDSSPLHYLVLIRAEHVLPQLYGRVITPTEVLRELEHPHAPQELREWLARRPSWLEVLDAPPHSVPDRLEEGESAAIELAKTLKADLLLVDDLPAREYAIGQGLTITGTLGVVRDAARQSLLDIEDALARLQGTSFRVTPELCQQIVDEAKKRPL